MVTTKASKEIESTKDSNTKTMVKASICNEMRHSKDHNLPSVTSQFVMKCGNKLIHPRYTWTDHDRLIKLAHYPSGD